MQEGNNRAIRVLRRLFKTLDVQTKVVEGGDQQTLLVLVGSQTYELVPVWAGEGFPQDVDRVLAGRDLPAVGGPRILVIVARRLSDVASAHLQNIGLGWADERGRARVMAQPGLLVALGAAKAPSLPKEGWRWSPSAGAVAEYLLTTLGPTVRSGNGPATLPPNTAIAGALPVSAPQVSKVLQGFDREGWTRKTGTERGPGAQRTLEDPSGLLSSWAAWQSHRHQSVERAHATWQDPQTFLFERLVPALPPNSWCLTGWMAADLRAPLATKVPTITCYLEPDAFDLDIDDVFAAVGLRRVETGARILFIRAEPQILTLARREAVPIADDPRLYADLLGAGARGEESASHLREVLLGY